VFDQGFIAVDISRRTCFFEDLANTDLVAIKLALLVIKIVHLLFVKIGPWHISSSAPIPFSSHFLEIGAILAAVL
jgi:hypothetical protein